MLNQQYDIRGESGEWWALYYGGINTLAMTKADMAARAELLRTHAFEIAGLAVPSHSVLPAPPVTTLKGGVTAWRGSAGAVKYVIERQDSASAPWQVVDSNATDADTPWVDPTPQPASGAASIELPYNADGKASPPSAPC